MASGNVRTKLGTKKRGVKQGGGIGDRYRLFPARGFHQVGACDRKKKVPKRKLWGGAPRSFTELGTCPMTPVGPEVKKEQRKEEKELGSATNETSQRGGGKKENAWGASKLKKKKKKRIQRTLNHDGTAS